MECLIGIQGPDFVLLAADTASCRSVVSMKQDHDKLHKLGSHVAMIVCGDSGDTVQFAEYISKNIQLYRIKNGYELSCPATASFTRRCLASSLRSRNAYMANLIVGGYDADTGPSIFYMDYLASLNQLPFAIHGYGSFFGLSIMDRLYRNDLSQDDAVRLVTATIKEIGKRLIINLPGFKIHIIDKDGIKQLPDISTKSLA